MCVFFPMELDKVLLCWLSLLESSLLEDWKLFLILTLFKAYVGFLGNSCSLEHPALDL